MSKTKSCVCFVSFTARQECLRPLNCTELKPPVHKECLQIYAARRVFVIAPDMSVLIHFH